MSFYIGLLIGGAVGSLVMALVNVASSDDIAIEYKKAQDERILHEYESD